MRTSRPKDDIPTGAPTIEDWVPVHAYADIRVGPKCVDMCLSGNAYNHPRFRDGCFITTSTVLKMDVDAGTAETYSGTKYSLGKPSPVFVKNLPEGVKLSDYNRNFRREDFDND